MKQVRNASHIGRLSFLSEEQKRDIYIAALDVLAKVGMKVYHEEARQMLLDAGCTETPEDRILMPR
ncbi:MAG: hypothetical protein ACYC6T_18865, partial [Thermoleophilia bacterium]